MEAPSRSTGALFLIVVVAGLFLLSDGFILTKDSADLVHCKPCEQISIVQDAKGNLVSKVEKEQCRPLPADCEAVRVKCGCCDVCASKEKEPCGAWRPRCEKALTCSNVETGVEKADVEWYNFDFVGICVKNTKGAKE
ncbi:insulin-like growth factor-binding protein 5 [Lingula anatina]|uniref:Insulin-like growth factor-binding protein 5 n=1 Tax=Lingula anatina TaxID=7574 RepID=A0A1S3JH90_LINAN|nr:insulin-like growth factor-binding protein 5 [Lingula anatina]|eukprot:XP_013409264.1 insulin-like growth factor-binding protein 5 [Lingula anatina]